MTRVVREKVEYRVLKAYGAGMDLRAIADHHDVPHGRVSLIVQDIARFNRSFARTLAADWERQAGGPPPLRRAPTTFAPAAAPAPPAAVPTPPPEPEPEPAIEPRPAPAGWSGWLCEPTGRRYRDPGPHGAPKRCGCRLVPIAVTRRTS